MNAMSKQELYNIWAPPESAWSPWVKPTLFSFLDFVPENFASNMDPTVAPGVATRDVQPAMELDLSFLLKAPAALILDLPGAQAVQHALQLARAGFRPVPLYNATPGPSAATWISFSAAIVEVRPILIELICIARELSQIPIRPDAPPAFLLNYNRREGRAPSEGDFDNRSVSFPTDFPSGNLLLNRGIEKAYVIRRESGVVQADLEHTLRKWQEAGVKLFVKSDSSAPPQDLIVAPLSWLRSLFARIGVAMGLRRNLLGGFGGVLPAAGSG